MSYWRLKDGEWAEAKRPDDVAIPILMWPLACAFGFAIALTVVAHSWRRPKNKKKADKQ